MEKGVNLGVTPFVQSLAALLLFALLTLYTLLIFHHREKFSTWGVLDAIVAYVAIALNLYCALLSLDIHGGHVFVAHFGSLEIALISICYFSSIAVFRRASVRIAETGFFDRFSDTEKFLLRNPPRSNSDLSIYFLVGAVIYGFLVYRLDVVFKI